LPIARSKYDTNCANSAASSSSRRARAEAVGCDLVVERERADELAVAAQRRREQRAHVGAVRGAARIGGDLALEQRRAAPQHVDRDILVEPEQALLERAIRGAEVGADREAMSVLVLEAQHRVIGLEHHRGRRGAETQHLGEVGGGDHADSGLVDGARDLCARGEAHLALRVRELARGGRGDLEQRLLGGAPAAVAAALDREHADELLADRERQRGVATAPSGWRRNAACGSARPGRRSAAGLDAVLAAEVAARERGGDEAQAARARSTGRSSRSRRRRAPRPTRTERRGRSGEDRAPAGSRSSPGPRHSARRRARAPRAPARAR
jgi:hypothetical protein